MVVQICLTLARVGMPRRCLTQGRSPAVHALKRRICWKRLYYGFVKIGGDQNLLRRRQEGFLAPRAATRISQR